MARPSGCSFLGSKATEVPITIGSLSGLQSSIIIDSGSDITLISQKLLEELSPAPRIRIGQKINLLQVTGNAAITGYVPLDLYFHTEEGPVKISVEAYVVKGMTSPMILGNDYSDQYSLSILRRNGDSYLEFGDSGRQTQVKNSTSSFMLDEDGHAFKIKAMSVFPVISSKATHRRNQRFRKKRRYQSTDPNVRAAARVVIAPETCVAVPVLANFPGNSDFIYVEKVFTTHRNTDDVYAAPDSFITRDQAKLHIANFSKQPITVRPGQVLGTARNPRTWLDRADKYSASQLEEMRARANMIRILAESKGVGSSLTVRSEAKEVLGEVPAWFTEEDVLSEPPVTGGPKTAEVAEDTIPSHRLLEELDINPELSPEKRKRIQDVIMRNEMAFGLDDRLGHLDARVQIPLKPGAKEISLPPFATSPANREVMDKQMDKWIQLGVIEPSKSPWAAPAFIVYRNGKPRMVVDYRRLNDIAISDEFPLPKQEDILQALVGSQWLTTLDALAGFTQLEVDPKEREKLAFRTHRGLWQFVRMPFGYKNGPSIFQRVMQNALAPFLWIFALVYIDDIVVFSLNFEDHLSHLDQVFRAISETGITLATTKCHFAYQSLLLLGQKVSRLGLSTHMEKVSAILQLDQPRNIHDLQIFLGMMVYFSSYIPFYAWIAAPLFTLLRKGAKWEWTDLHQEAFELCKQVLVNAPVRGYAVPGKPYRLYSDACDFGLAAILQQVQRIQLRDLRGTKAYEKCEKAFNEKLPVPTLVIQISKADNDVPPNETWGDTLDETWVYVERVIAYWSRVLKPAESNYSPTEREALALKEGLIKFQPYLEGETILAVTDHAALTWSKTFQNVNRRLLTWGTVFSAYPNLKIVHRAGRVHSNVDPISRLRRRVPIHDSPTVDATQHIAMNAEEDPLQDMYAKLGERFEEKLLTVATNFVASEFETEADYRCTITNVLDLPDIKEGSERNDYHTSSSYSIITSISSSEIDEWRTAYAEDPHWSKILYGFQGDPTEHEEISPYDLRNGLLYFQDWNGNLRLCVPEAMKLSVISDAHNVITEAAHGGYAKTYNRIASTYYWPKMSRDVKRYTDTCDICQKSKPRRHAPVGMLQPIPIPSHPFEVVSMDFIPELPASGGFDNVLVIVDKLTKYAIFIPTTIEISKEDTARLFYKHVISKFGIPKQIITDRDTRWRGDFWDTICKQMGMRRSLTTSYHPQSDGQTEVMNQGLEISLRAYIGPSRDDWSTHLDSLALAYNSTPHSATGYAPAYLLRGYVPVTGSTLIHHPEAVPRSGTPADATGKGGDNLIYPPEAVEEMVEEFTAHRHRAQEALTLGQHYQTKSYNKGRLTSEFHVGDQVLINPHSLRLLKSEKGRGKKLLMKYDGPFEIIRKISPVAYQLRMPTSYGMHPVLNIAHLETYNASPEEFGKRPAKSLNRADFEELPEVDVDRIVSERKKKGRNGRQITEYLVRFEGFSEDHDEWKTAVQLKNAPEILQSWRARMLRRRSSDTRLDNQDTRSATAESDSGDPHDAPEHEANRPTRSTESKVS